MRRLTMLGPAAFAFAVAAVLALTAGVARADAVPQLTAFSVSAAAVDVTYGTAQITVTMTVSDPDATGVGSGDIIAHGPARGYNPAGHLVQVGGTATNTRYRADITLPAGKAVDYHMDISCLPFGEFAYVDLQSQLAASGWNYHTIASVTAVPAAPVHFAFHRDVAGGLPVIIVSWDPPSAGQPIATGSTVTSSGCGTVRSNSYASVWFGSVPARTTTCAVTVSLTNSAGSSAAASESARV